MLSAVYHEGKTKENIIPHLTQITENNCFKRFWTIQLLEIKYKSNMQKNLA